MVARGYHWQLGIDSLHVASRWLGIGAGQETGAIDHQIRSRTQSNQFKCIHTLSHRLLFPTSLLCSSPLLYFSLLHFLWSHSFIHLFIHSSSLPLPPPPSLSLSLSLSLFCTTIIRIKQHNFARSAQKLKSILRSALKNMRNLQCVDRAIVVCVYTSILE